VILYEPGFIVHCGTTDVQIGDPFYSDLVAQVCAADHALVHGCTPWIERAAGACS
jgi:hypothetical protein